MTCPTFRTQIQESLDGPLDEAERRTLDAHLASCPECRAYQADMRALDAGLSALPRPQAPPALLAGLELAVRPRRRVPNWAWSTAAGVLVLVGLWKLAPGLAPHPVPEATPATVATEPAGDPLLGWLDPEPPSSSALLSAFDPTGEE